MASIKKLAEKETWKGAVIVPKQSRPKDWTEVTANVVTDVTAGVIGGTTGSFFGKYSVPVGLAASIVGHIYGQRWMTALGIGLIAAPFDPFKAGRVAEGTGFSLKAEFEAGKQRTRDYVETLKEKFYINKLFGKKQSDQSSDSSETPDTPTVNGLDPGVEKATLDRLTDYDQQIISEGIERQASGGGAPPDGAAYMNGVDLNLDELPHII